MKLSSNITRDEIAHRAHEIWEQTGQPHGYETEHWLQAERELHDQPNKQETKQPVKNGLDSKSSRGSTTPKASRR